MNKLIKKAKQNWCKQCNVILQFWPSILYSLFSILQSENTFILGFMNYHGNRQLVIYTAQTHAVAVSSLLCGFELNCDDDIKWVSFTGLCVYLVIVNLSSSACSSALSLWQAWLRPLALFALHLVHLAKSLCGMTVLLSALPHKANCQKRGVMGVPKGLGGGWD